MVHAIGLGRQLEIGDWSVPQVAGPEEEPGRLEDIERAAIEEALAAVGGTRRAAAERLGVGLRTLYDKLKRYRLEGAS